MNKVIKVFISIFLISFFTQAFAQKPAFYIRLNRSLHLKNDTLQAQPINFEPQDIIYNNLVDFSSNKIKIQKNGDYEINGFVNINPGVLSKKDDNISIAVYWYKNKNMPSEKLLYTAEQTYTRGNLDVSRSFIFPETEITLQNHDEISIWVKILPTSTISINSSKNYHHINHPTGFSQITGLRIVEVHK